jgi:hypothetical protein
MRRWRSRSLTPDYDIPARPGRPLGRTPGGLLKEIEMRGGGIGIVGVVIIVLVILWLVGVIKL